VRSICGLSYIVLKLQDSGPLAARAAAHPKTALVAPRGRERHCYAPNERAEAAPRRSAVDTWPGVNNSASPPPFFKRIMACGGRARAHAAFVLALFRSLLTNPWHIRTRGNGAKGGGGACLNSNSDLEMMVPPH